MAVKYYNARTQAELQLSKNFKVREFACKDGTISTPISQELVTMLQRLRDRLGVPINISSAYRTPKYNKAVGGSTNSQHLYGKAADITCSVDPLVVAWVAQDLGFHGVECGIGSNYVHVDMRAGWWFAVKPLANKKYETVPKLFTTIKYGSRNQTVTVLELYLKKLGLYAGPIDEHCGPGLEMAIKEFQKKYGLEVDLSFGPKSWDKLVHVIYGK